MATLSFYGGVGSVTGSKYLLEHAGKKVLIDCGLFQGDRHLRERNWQAPPFDPHEIDAVIITHAHVDHTGYLPRLVKLGFGGKVYTSRATADLMKLLLTDSARLHEEEAEYRNRKKLTRHNPALPLYDERDAEDALELLAPVPNDGKQIEICENFTASFQVAGHILGASMVRVSLEKARENGDAVSVLFSGDLGHYDQPILNDPAAPPACDYLMVESTYGNRLHGGESAGEQLAQIINRIAERDAPLLIPAFAVGRTQEILYLIRDLEEDGKIPVLPVRVDSPMAADATALYNRFPEEHDREYASILMEKRHPLRTKNLMTASSPEESKAINKERGARIIITASGMMTGGRVLHHAVRILPDERAAIAFVGYQAAGTLGRRIQDGAPEVRIMKHPVPVNAEVATIHGFSAHADWKAVLRWLSGLKREPQTIFTTHGEPDAAAAMAQHIREHFDWRAIVPEYGETVELK